jgi:hypothetical protein
MIEGSQVVVREDRFTQTRQGGYPAQSGYGAAASRPAPVDPANQQPSQQLFVNNLPYSTDSAALLALSPSAINAEVMMMGGRSKGMGVLEYPSLESSAEALGMFCVFFSSQLIGSYHPGAGSTVWIWKNAS